MVSSCSAPTFVPSELPYGSELVGRRVERVHAHRRKEVGQEAIRHRRDADGEPGQLNADRLRVLSRPVESRRRSECARAHRPRDVEDEVRLRVRTTVERRVCREHGLSRRESEQCREKDEGGGAGQQRASLRWLEPELRAQRLQTAPPEHEEHERDEPDERHEPGQRGDEGYPHLETTRLSGRSGGATRGAAVTAGSAPGTPHARHRGRERGVDHQHSDFG